MARELPDPYGVEFLKIISDLDKTLNVKFSLARQSETAECIINKAWSHTWREQDFDVEIESICFDSSLSERLIITITKPKITQPSPLMEAVMNYIKGISGIYVSVNVDSYQARKWYNYSEVT